MQYLQERLNCNASKPTCNIKKSKQFWESLNIQYKEKIKNNYSIICHTIPIFVNLNLSENPMLNKMHNDNQNVLKLP